MRIEASGQFIQIPDSLRAKLSDGQTVFVSVIKELAPGKWAVGIRGTVLTARSTLELTAGEVLQARVSREGTAISLRLLSTPFPLHDWLAREGIPTDPLSLLVVSNLMQAKVKLDVPLIETIRRLIEKKNDPERAARLYALCAAKGISLDSVGLPELTGMLEYGSGGQPEQRQRPQRRQSDPRDRAQIRSHLKQILQTGQGEPNGLTVFNHLAAGAPDEKWVFCPFAIGEDLGLQGTFRFLLDETGQAVRKLVVVVHDEQNRQSQFVLTPRTAGWHLSVASDQKQVAGKPVRHWVESVRILDKLRVKCDDIIHDTAGGDGLGGSTVAPDYRRIDTQG